MSPRLRVRKGLPESEMLHWKCGESLVRHSPGVGLQRTHVIPRQEPVARRRIGSATIQIVRWIVGLGVLAWVVKANGGWRIVQLPFDYPGAIAAFILQVLVGAVVEASRIRMLCAAAVVDIPFPFAYRLVAVATLFNMAIPGGTGGDVLKLVNLAQRVPGKRAEFTALLLLDRMIGMTSILLVTLGTASLALLTGSAPPRLIGIVITPALLLLGVVALVVVMANRGPRSLVLRLVPGSWTRIRGLLNRAYDTAEVLSRQPLVLLRALAISILAQCVMASAFAIAAQSLLPGASPLLVAAVAFTGLLVNAIPVTPGGIGVGEAAFEGLFALVGFNGGARLLICWRLGQIPFAMLGAWYFTRHGEAMKPPMPDAA